MNALIIVLRILEMSVFQVNVWVCDVCGKTETTFEETSPYSDPVVIPPNDKNWDYLDDERLACQECLENYEHDSN